MGSRFCFVTEPVEHGDRIFFCNADYREKYFGTNLGDGHDGHICNEFGLDRKKCNSYVYDFLDQKFRIHYINSEIDDRVSAEKWVRKVDYKPLVGHFKRLFFTKKDSGKYYVALRFLEKFHIPFSEIHNPYPDDRSVNYLVDFEDNQTEHYLGLGAYLSTEAGFRDEILFLLYGFNVLEILKYCDKDDQRVSMSYIWNDSENRSVNLALNKLINYYGVMDRYDLYPYIFEDIIKKYKICRPSLRGVADNQEYYRLITQLENDMRLSREMPSRWKSEQEMFRIIHKMFPDAVFNYENFDWLGHQHLDVFVPSEKLAFEYQGEQHYEVGFMGGGAKDLEKVAVLDKRKRGLCIQAGVRLIEWSYQEPLTSATLALKLGLEPDHTQLSLF